MQQCRGASEASMPSEESQDRRYFQYDSTYKTFWKRHNSRDKIRSVAAQLGGGGFLIKEYIQGTFGVMEIFYILTI